MPPHAHGDQRMALYIVSLLPPQCGLWGSDSGNGLGAGDCQVSPSKQGRPLTQLKPIGNHYKELHGVFRIPV